MISMESVNCPNTVYYHKNWVTIHWVHSQALKNFLTKKRENVPKFIHLEC